MIQPVTLGLITGIFLGYLLVGFIMWIAFHDENTDPPWWFIFTWAIFRWLP